MNLSSPLVSKILDVILLMMSSNQSIYVMRLVFATQRSVITKVCAGTTQILFKFIELIVLILRFYHQHKYLALYETWLYPVGYLEILFTQYPPVPAHNI